MFRWVAAAVLVLGLVEFRFATADKVQDMELLYRMLEKAEEKKAVSGFSIVGKVAWQSSTLNDYTAAKAVDGSDSSIMYPSAKCSHTVSDTKNPWWMVDLGEAHCISKVTILNRGDCCSERLEGAIVRAGNIPIPGENLICGSPVTAAQAAPSGGTIVMECSSALEARYISVDIPGQATLQLCEVTVEEDPALCESKGFCIVNKPAVQSSDYNGALYKAGKAVDGSRSTIMYPDDHCSHTGQEKEPWWRVDLGVEKCVTSVTILNRGDCCSERLTNAIVRAGRNEKVIANQACGAPVTAAEAEPLGGTIVKYCGRPLRARYVSVDMPNTSLLQLCEVQVKVLSSGACSI